MKKLLILLLLLAVQTVLGQTKNYPPIFEDPRSIVVDSKDNVYVALKNGLGKVTPDGKFLNLSSLPENNRKIGELRNLVIDSKDNLYEGSGNTIQKITIDKNNVITVEPFAGNPYSYENADGHRQKAVFNSIGKMAIDKNDNIYVTDGWNKIADKVRANFVTDGFYQKDPKLKYIRAFSIVRKISPNGTVSTLKTNDGKYVMPNGVAGMALDLDGNIVYSTGGVSRAVFRIDTKTGVFFHIAGQPYKREYCPVYTPGDINAAELFSPETILVNDKNEIIFADERSQRISKVANGKVTTLAGNNPIDPCSQNIGGSAREGHKDGKALSALFAFPKGIAYDSKGNLYISDSWNNCIRKLSPEGVVSSVTEVHPRFS